MENTLQCPECLKLFKQKSDLKRHAVVHSKVKQFTCTKCHKKFALKGNLDKHMNLYHAGAIVRDYKCLTCGKSFLKMSHLNDHNVVHTKERNFPCSVCGKDFGLKNNLKRHMESHGSRSVIVKNHKCLKCKKLFRSKNSLIAHEVVHSGEKKFSCSKCEKQFAQKSMLRYHTNNKKIPCGKMEQEQEKPPSIGSALKCWVCGEEPGFKSNLVDRFKPQNMGMRYVCPKCDVQLEGADNLEGYFKTFSNLLHLIDGRIIVKWVRK